MEDARLFDESQARETIDRLNRSLNHWQQLLSGEWGQDSERLALLRMRSEFHGAIEASMQSSPPATASSRDTQILQFVSRITHVDALPPSQHEASGEDEMQQLLGPSRPRGDLDYLIDDFEQADSQVAELGGQPNDRQKVAEAFIEQAGKIRGKIQVFRQMLSGEEPGENSQFISGMVSRITDRESEVLVALQAAGAIGLESTNRLTAEVLAQQATGEKKASKHFVSLLVKMWFAGLIDNARHHGSGHGYFLTPFGSQVTRSLPDERQQQDELITKT